VRRTADQQRTTPQERRAAQHSGTPSAGGMPVKKKARIKRAFE
jgi:hypothetical protein